MCTLCFCIKATLKSITVVKNDTYTKELQDEFDGIRNTFHMGVHSCMVCMCAHEANYTEHQFYRVLIKSLYKQAYVLKAIMHLAQAINVPCSIWTTNTANSQSFASLVVLLVLSNNHVIDALTPFRNQAREHLLDYFVATLENPTMNLNTGHRSTQRVLPPDFTTAATLLAATENMAAEECQYEEAPFGYTPAPYQDHNDSSMAESDKDNGGGKQTVTMTHNHSIDTHGNDSGPPCKPPPPVDEPSPLTPLLHIAHLTLRQPPRALFLPTQQIAWMPATGITTVLAPYFQWLSFLHFSSTQRQNAESQV